MLSLAVFCFELCILKHLWSAARLSSAWLVWDGLSQDGLSVLYRLACVWFHGEDREASHRQSREHQSDQPKEVASAPRFTEWEINSQLMGGGGKPHWRQSR